MLEISKYDWATNSELLKLMVYSLAQELKDKPAYGLTVKDNGTAFENVLEQHLFRATNLYNSMINGSSREMLNRNEQINSFLNKSLKITE